jgi:four helix bundle protein
VKAWEEQMRTRTRQFALDVMRFVRDLPDDPMLDPVKRQLPRSACAVASNYRSSCRARSYAEFTARLGVVLEEADESEGWLDLLHDGALMNGGQELERLRREAQELRAVFFAACRTAQSRARTKR